MKIGDEVYVHGYVDEIRNDVVIIRNKGGYFGTVAEEILLTDISYLLAEQTEPQTDGFTKWAKSVADSYRTEPQTERKCIDCKFLTYKWNKVWCDIKCENPHDVVCDKWAERKK